ncbi:MAG: CRTAC1 family protein [Armatimonadota bacterium]
MRRLSLLLAILSVAGCTRKPEMAEPTPSERPSSSPVIFPEVADASGLAFAWSSGGKSPLNILETLGFGIALFDFDDDGWTDVMFTGNPRCALFRNLGGLRFEPVTGFAEAVGDGWYQGCAAGDFNNDGRPDVFVSGYHCGALMINQGEGRFENRTAGSGLMTTLWTSSCGTADFDRDGNLDLLVSAYVAFGPDEPQLIDFKGVMAAGTPSHYEAEKARLYLGNGDGTFRDATSAWGVDKVHGKGLGVAIGDADDDGWQDVYVSNDVMPCDFLHNEGDRFSNIGLENGTAYMATGARQSGMGADFGDFDGDGDLDLFVCNFAKEPSSVYQAEVPGRSYRDVSLASGIGAACMPYVKFGAQWLDYDNDGHLDVFLTSGDVQDNVAEIYNREYAQRNQLFHNRGDGTFTLVPEPSPGMEAPIVGRGTAAGDLDNDGDVDIVVVDIEGPARLFRNEAAAGNHFLEVRCRRADTGADAVGAKVVVRADGGQWVREVHQAGSFHSSLDPRVHIGLGDAARVDGVTVRWPDGEVQEFGEVPIDCLVEVRQGGEASVEWRRGGAAAP